MKYDLEVQGFYAHGWECVFTASDFKEARDILADYRMSDPVTRYRIRKVRRKASV